MSLKMKTFKLKLLEIYILDKLTRFLDKTPIPFEYWKFLAKRHFDLIVSTFESRNKRTEKKRV